MRKTIMALCAIMLAVCFMSAAMAETAMEGLIARLTEGFTEETALGEPDTIVPENTTNTYTMLIFFAEDGQIVAANEEGTWGWTGLPIEKGVAVIKAVCENWETVAAPFEEGTFVVVLPAVLEQDTVYITNSARAQEFCEVFKDF